MGNFTDIPVNFVGFFTVVCIQFVGIYGLFCAVDGLRFAGCPHPAGTTFYNGILPLVLPFWTPKKEAKKVPATSDSAGGPA